jgi:hypothetical protein
MRKRSNKMNNGYIGGPAYPQPYVDGGGIVNAYKWYVTTVDLSIGEWRRPEYWLSLPKMVQGDQLFAGLHGVFKGASGNTGTTADSNYVALQIVLQNSGHSYFVNWGDGTTTRHLSNTRAQYQYNWANIDASTETPEGYRQVVIQAYPGTGATMTQFDMRPNYTAAGITLSNLRSSGWLDLKIAGPALTTIYFQQYAVNNFRNFYVKQVEVVGTMNLSGPGHGFNNFQSLERLIGTEWTSTLTDMGGFFASCVSLKHIPLLNTRRNTNMIYFILDCRSLERFPPIDTSNVTTFLQLAQEGSGGGGSLRSIPILNTSKVQLWETAFQRQRCLRSVPNFDFSAATNLAGLFSQCSSLRKAPPIVAPNATTIRELFSACQTLTDIAGVCAPNATDASAMFQNCYALRKAPPLNTSKIRNFASMFNRCFSLSSIPLYDTSAGITFTGMLNGVFSMAELPPFNLNGASAGSTAAGAGPLLNILGLGSELSISLRRATMQNTRRSISYAGLSLSATELNSIFTGLADVSSHGATITITNNWGTATCNRTIATSKGWTVVG